MTFEGCMGLMISVGGKRVFALREQRQGGRNRMVYGGGEKTLGMWIIKEFGADFYWSERKFEKNSYDA